MDILNKPNSKTRYCDGPPTTEEQLWNQDTVNVVFDQNKILVEKLNQVNQGLDWTESDTKISQVRRWYYELLEQYNHLAQHLAKVIKGQADNDMLALVQFQAKTIDQLLGPKVKKAKPEKFWSQMKDLFATSQTEKAGGLWEEREYAPIMGISSAENFELLRKIMIYKDKESAETETRLKPITPSRKENINPKPLDTKREQSKELHRKQLQLLKSENEELSAALDSLTLKLVQIEGTRSSVAQELEDLLDKERQDNEIIRSERDLLVTELKKATKLDEERDTRESSSTEFKIYMKEIEDLKNENTDKSATIRILESQLEEMGVSGDIRRFVLRAVLNSEKAVKTLEDKMVFLKETLISAKIL